MLLDSQGSFGGHWIRVIFSGCKIRRENLWLVYLQPTTNHRFSLRILQPEKITLHQMAVLSFSASWRKVLYEQIRHQQHIRYNGHSVAYPRRNMVIASSSFCSTSYGLPSSF
jgi:hypothetical protein